MRLFGFLILLFYTFSAIGQTNSNVPIGTWRTHLPTTSVATLSIVNNKIYAASVKSSFTYDISDNHLAPLSKMDGLTQSDIEIIRFNEATKTGLIGYSNGNIDIIRNGILSNFDVIFRSTVAGSKKINNITLYNDIALISCDYGVTVIDLKRNEVIESWMNLRAGGMPNIVYGAILTADKDSVFLATEYGVMSAQYDKPGINLMDFTNWKVYTNISTTGANAVGELNGRIYAGIYKTGVFVLAGSTWQNIGLTIDTFCYNLTNSNNRLLVSSGKKLFSIQNPTTYTAVVVPSFLENLHDAIYDKGQHIHLILNNAPYQAKYSPSFTDTLPDGHYIALSFLSRSYHESLKHFGASDLRQFTVGKATPEKVDLTKPLMFYSRPKGEYKGKDTANVLLDFFLVNTTLSETGNRVRATVNGKSFIITDWRGYILKGLPLGESTIKLELLDASEKPIPGKYNVVERKITLLQQ